MLTNWKDNFASVFPVSLVWETILGVETAIFSGENMTQWHLRLGEKCQTTGRIQRFQERGRQGI